ncbi:photosystem reaction center subunit H [Sphingobium lactosutens]|nr:photosystem reaction center subunit H [Sphingobium lactosutens]
MIAAVMTVANLGARVTGWGFVIFAVGSIAWACVGVSSGRINLLATNGFLTLVNLVGIWRWLGQQRAYDDGGDSAKSARMQASEPSLFTAIKIAAIAVVDDRGEPVGTGVEALIACASGEISYVVVASGGIAGAGEELRAVPHNEVRFACEQLSLTISVAAFGGLTPLADGDWSAEVRS